MAVIYFSMEYFDTNISLCIFAKHRSQIRKWLIAKVELRLNGIYKENNWNVTHFTTKEVSKTI